MKSVKFLEEAKKMYELKTDMALAEKLNMSKGAISLYMAGKRIMDNEACIALALALGIDPMKIIMAADIDRAERAGQHSLWEVFTARTAAAGSVALLALVTLFLTPAPSEAAPVLKDSGRMIYLMSNLLENCTQCAHGPNGCFFGTDDSPRLIANIFA